MSVTQVVDLKAFISELITENFDINDVGTAPIVDTAYPEVGVMSDQQPIYISVLVDDIEHREIGLSGKYLRCKAHMNIILFCFLERDSRLVENQIKKILKQNAKYPTTSSFPTPNVDYIHIGVFHEADDIVSSPAQFIREMEFIVVYQENYN